jgi:hypothetical protein
MKILSYIAGLLIILSSCTMVTSKNLPGKKKTSFPKNLQGTYEFKYPKSLAEMIGEVNSELVIDANKIVMTTSGESNEMPLNDSLFLTTIKKDMYLSIGAEPSLTVFKLVKNGKNWDLFPMYTESATIDEMRPYFKDIQAQEMPSEEGEETGNIMYEVSIDEKKLASYFKSNLPSKDPFKLIRK